MSLMKHRSDVSGISFLISSENFFCSWSATWKSATSILKLSFLRAFKWTIFESRENRQDLLRVSLVSVNEKLICFQNWFWTFWSSHFCLPTHVWYFPGFPWLVSRLTGSSLSGKHKCAWAVKLLLTLLQFLKPAKRVVRIQNPSTNFAIDTAEPIYMKIGSIIAYTLGFQLGVQDHLVVYREASSIATSKVSECTWLNL